MKYYVYGHIRPDLNEFFYIGFGTKSLEDIKCNSYTRANSKIDRNSIWKNIVNKNNGNYTIKILKEFKYRKAALNYEIKLIAKYGRKCLNEGSLANITIGGEGAVYNNITYGQYDKYGYLIKIWNNRNDILNYYNTTDGSTLYLSLKTLNRTFKKFYWREFLRGVDKEGYPEVLIKPTQPTLTTLITLSHNRIFQYDLDGNFIKEWDSVKKAAYENNITIKAIYNSANSTNNSSAKSMWVINKKDPINKIPKFIDLNKKKVYCFDLYGKFLNEYASVNEAAIQTNNDPSVIFKCLKGQRNTSKGLRWSTEPTIKINFINMYSLQNEFLKSFITLEEVKNFLKINSNTAIMNCFIGKQKQAYGYIWKKEVKIFNV